MKSVRRVGSSGLGGKSCDVGSANSCDVGSANSCDVGSANSCDVGSANSCDVGSANSCDVGSANSKVHTILLRFGVRTVQFYFLLLICTNANIY